MLLLRLGAAECGLFVLMSSVWPSGVERATCVAAMAPFAPGLFSIMIVCLSATPSGWAIMRVIVSVPLPGPNGTMMLTGLAGYNCALAMREKAGKAAAPAARCRN